MRRRQDRSVVGTRCPRSDRTTNDVHVRAPDIDVGASVDIDVGTAVDIDVGATIDVDGPAVSSAPPPRRAAENSLSSACTAISNAAIVAELGPASPADRTIAATALCQNMLRMIALSPLLRLIVSVISLCRDTKLLRANASSVEIDLGPMSPYPTAEREI